MQAKSWLSFPALGQCSVFCSTSGTTWLDLHTFCMRKQSSGELFAWAFGLLVSWSPGLMSSSAPLAWMFKDNGGELRGE